MFGDSRQGAGRARARSTGTPPASSHMLGRHARASPESQRRSGGADRIRRPRRIAAMHVNDVIGADTTFPEPSLVVTREPWAAETLDAYRPLFTDMATSLGQQPDDEADDAARPDDADDGRPQPDDGAGHDGDVGRVDGRQRCRNACSALFDLPIPRERTRSCSSAARSTSSPPSGRSRSTRCGCGCSPTSCPATGCSRSRTSATDLTDLVQRHVGGFQPDPSAIADKLGGVDARRQRRSDGRRCSRHSPTPRSCSARSSPPANGRLQPRSTPPCARSSATPTGSSTPSPCGSSVATRSGSPRRCAANASEHRTRRSVRRTVARHPRRRGTGDARQGVHPGRGRPRRGDRAHPLLDLPTRCRPRARSKLLVSGSPGSAA